MSNQSGKWKLRLLIREVDTYLKKSGCCQFSKRAKAVLRKKIQWYITQLISMSENFAERGQVDTVSKIHVEKAFDHLTNSPHNQFFRYLGTIGGIILGASFSVLLTMIFVKQFSALTILVPTVLCIIGASMVVLHIAKDF